ncbi:MAG TPA: hypothetical protein VGN34_00870, partial [Ktedonobacteraceae bacterium]
MEKQSEEGIIQQESSADNRDSDASGLQADDHPLLPILSSSLINHALNTHDVSSTATLARTLSIASVLARHHEKHALHEKLCEESLTLFRELGDSRGIATMLNEKGHSVYQQGGGQEAQTFYTESLALFQHQDDKQGMAEVML